MWVRACVCVVCVCGVCVCVCVCVTGSPLLSGIAGQLFLFHDWQSAIEWNCRSFIFISFLFHDWQSAIEWNCRSVIGMSLSEH